MRKRLRKWTERMRKVTVHEKVVALNSGSLLAPAVFACTQCTVRMYIIGSRLWIDSDDLVS
jgi:ribosomal protein L33